jgi:hypothetical protein
MYSAEEEKSDDLVGATGAGSALDPPSHLQRDSSKTVVEGARLSRRGKSAKKANKPTRVHPDSKRARRERERRSDDTQLIVKPAAALKSGGGAREPYMSGVDFMTRLGMPGIAGVFTPVERHLLIDLHATFDGDLEQIYAAWGWFVAANAVDDGPYRNQIRVKTKDQLNKKIVSMLAFDAAREAASSARGRQYLTKGGDAFDALRSQMLSGSTRITETTVVTESVTSRTTVTAATVRDGASAMLSSVSETKHSRVRVTEASVNTAGPMDIDSPLTTSATSRSPSGVRKRKSTPDVDAEPSFSQFTAQEDALLSRLVSECRTSSGNVAWERVIEQWRKAVEDDPASIHSASIDRLSGRYQYLRRKTSGSAKKRRLLDKSSNPPVTSDKPTSCASSSALASLPSQGTA